MRIEIDHRLCEANALCMVIAPEVFEVQSDDTLHLRLAEPDDSLLHKVLDAARACPRRAITVHATPEAS
jgi:ferredoxin